MKQIWAWYENHVLENSIITAIILYLQIPHTIAAADCFFLKDHVLYGVNSVTDFLLYGIDLLEIVPIFQVTMTGLAAFRKKLNHV